VYRVRFWVENFSRDDTAKDAVRWPQPIGPEVHVLEVEWEWLEGGRELEADVLAPPSPEE